MPAADAPDDAVLIEPVLAGPQPELLMVSRGGPRLRVNGQPAPLVALLAERDQLQLSEDLILHVATYHEPRIGRPSPDQVGRGFLIFSPSPTETTLIELTPSLIRPILALLEGLQATRHLPLPARGWMSASKLAEAIAGRDEHLLETEEQTVRAYISKINKEVRRAAARSGREGPVLIEHRRLLGFRLATDRLVIIDGTNAGQAGKQPPRGRPKPKLP